MFTQVLTKIYIVAWAYDLGPGFGINTSFVFHRLDGTYPVAKLALRSAYRDFFKYFFKCLLQRTGVDAIQPWRHKRLEREDCPFELCPINYFVQSITLARTMGIKYSWLSIAVWGLRCPRSESVAWALKTHSYGCSFELRRDPSKSQVSYGVPYVEPFEI